MQRFDGVVHVTAAGQAWNAVLAAGGRCQQCACRFADRAGKSQHLGGCDGGQQRRRGWAGGQHTLRAVGDGDRAPGGIGYVRGHGWCRGQQNQDRDQAVHPGCLLRPTIYPVGYNGKRSG